LLADKNWRKNKEGGAAGKKGGKSIFQRVRRREGRANQNFSLGICSPHNDVVANGRFTQIIMEIIKEKDGEWEICRGL